MIGLNLVEQRARQLLKEGRISDLFDLLFNSYYSRIYNQCYAATMCCDTAQDLAQEVFIRAIKAVRGFESRATFKTWLYSIAAACCIDHYRSRSRQNRTIQYQAQLPDVQTTDKDIEADHVLLKILAECFSELTHTQRQSVILKILEECTFREIALVIDQNEKTVQSRVGRSINLLRDCARKRGATT